MTKNATHLPDISVIVCSYNHEKWVERCIRSLTHQKHISGKEYEIILIDDCSDDNTAEIVGNLGVRNLTFIRNEKNLGLPSSLNKAIRRAKGRYIIRVDSDDFIARETLYFMKFFLDKNRHYQGVACDYVKVSADEGEMYRKHAMEDEIACGVMYRKECLFDIGLYNEQFDMREGHELRRRVLEKYRLAHLELPFYKYREHDANRTNDKEQVAKYDQMLNGEN